MRATTHSWKAGVSEEPARRASLASGEGSHQNCPDIFVDTICTNDKRNCQGGLHQDESELHPERRPEHAVLPEMHAQPLIFGTNEDGRNDVATPIHVRFSRVPGPGLGIVQAYMKSNKNPS